MIGSSDEDVPVRSFTDYGSLKEDDKFSIDEQEQSTLRNVYKLLEEAVASLDQWHAFERKADSELSLKQQIKAHQLAAEILTPTLDAVGQALATVDAKFKQRNSQ